MALGLNSPIRTEDIERVEVLKEAKVFLLVGHHEDSVVVKHDMGAVDTLFKPANMVMRAVDDRARYKILSHQEEEALVHWATDTSDRIDFYRLAGVHNLDTDPDAIAAKDMTDSIGFGNAQSGNPWLKMETLQLLDLEQAFKQREQGNKEGLRTIRRALKAPGGLEKLGQIIAADMVIGNKDRFLPNMQATAYIVGNSTFVLRTVANVGNVFVELNDTNRAEIRGNDFVGWGTGFADVRSPLNEAVRGQWLARVILNTQERHRFAKHIIEDVEILLSPHRKNFARSVLGITAKDRLSQGMKQGIRAIKEKLERKFPPLARPVGVQERIGILSAIRP